MILNVDDNALVKHVTCPTCGGVSVYAASNLFRPFCSERCKQIDLGAWASERFSLPEHSIEKQSVESENQ
jgi:hypothetical protein